jgi:hypothetical protein
MIQIAALRFKFPALDEQVFVDWHGPQIFNRELGGDRADPSETVRLPHHFVKKSGDDASVDESGTSLVLGANAEGPANPLRGLILLKGELHAA